MSFFRRSYKTNSDSRIIQTMSDNSHSKAIFNYPRLSPSNKIPVGSRNIYSRRNEQKPNTETLQINENNSRKNFNLNHNTISEEKNLRNSNINHNFYVSKKIELNNTNNPNQTTKDIHKIFEKKNYEKNGQNNNNENYRKTSSDILNKNSSNIYYININNKRNENDIKNKTINIDNNIDKRRNNNLIKNKKDNKEDNKFKMNIISRNLNLNSSYDQIKEFKYIQRQNNLNTRKEFSTLNNNSSSYNNRIIKTEKIIPFKNKIKIPNNTKEFDANKSKNKSGQNFHINKNYSFSSSLDFIKKVGNPSDSMHMKQNNSNTLYDLSKIKKEVKNNNNINNNNYKTIPHTILNTNSSKEMKNYTRRKININLNTDSISNKPEETGKEKNKYAIKTTITNKRNILNKKITENKPDINKNNNKNNNNKKYSSYTYVQRSKNKEEMKENEVISDRRKNLIIIPRKEEKVYLTKRPQLSNNLLNEKEMNNISISYISSSKKNVNSTNNSGKKFNKEENNSITYIKTSSNKKEKQNNGKYQDSNNKKINKFVLINNPNYSNKQNETISIKEKLDVNKEGKKPEINYDIKNNIKEDLEDKNKILTQKLEKRFDNINNDFDEINKAPSNDINKIENNINNNEININKDNYINKLIENIEINKNLNSTQKLEQKIKDLESKLDDLNNKPISEFNLAETENNINKYSILDKPGLSDITKEYLSSNLDYLAPNNELSDFSKAYMIGLDVFNNIISDRPSLSGLTKEFLKENEEEPKSNNF